MRSSSSTFSTSSTFDFLLKRTGGIAFDAFAADDVLRRACARSLEIIGEAVKNISPHLRKKHKDVEWTKIAGLRDKLIHGYFDVDLGILLTAGTVWQRDDDGVQPAWRSATFRPWTRNKTVSEIGVDGQCFLDVQLLHCGRNTST